MRKLTTGPRNPITPPEGTEHPGAVDRVVKHTTRDGKPARRVTLQRRYNTTPEDLWDALTSAERLPRWLLPISGELKLGGRFQLEGNAAGTITECEPPHFLSTTWEFGDGLNWLEVRIERSGDGSLLTLSHICPIDDHWRKYGPSAVGIGWDLALLGLEQHLHGKDGSGHFSGDHAGTAEGRKTIAGLSKAWRGAAIASGDDPAAAEEAAKRTAEFYSGSQEED